jgi:hypothetical protein
VLNLISINSSKIESNSSILIIVNEDDLYSYFPFYVIPEVNSIDKYGIVSVTFSESMKSLKNYTSIINNTALELSIMNNK